MSEPLIKVELDGYVATIVLARSGARNALNAELSRQISQAVAFVSRSPARAVVVRGEGACFSAGTDLAFHQERLKATSSDNQVVLRRFWDECLSLRGVAVPTVAALHGSASGAGLCLAMACDLRVAAEGTQFSLGFLKLGLHPGVGASWLLPRLVGPAPAAELLMTGRIFDAAEASALKLVNEVVAPAAHLGERAKQLARELSGAGPAAMAQLKQSLLAAEVGQLEAALEMEVTAQVAGYGTREVADAVAAEVQRHATRFGSA